MTGTERIWRSHGVGSKMHPARQLPPMQSGCTIGCAAERMCLSQFRRYAGKYVGRVFVDRQDCSDTKGGKRLAKRQTYLLSMSPPRYILYSGQCKTRSETSCMTGGSVLSTITTCRNDLIEEQILEIETERALHSVRACLEHLLTHFLFPTGGGSRYRGLEAGRARGGARGQLWLAACDSHSPL